MPSGETYLATGLEVELCIQHCKNSGKWGEGGDGEDIAKPLLMRLAIFVGQNGPETQPCMSSADRLAF